MSRARVLPRIAAVLTAVIAVITVATAPAYAADAVNVNFDAPGSLVPGRGGGLSVSLQNRTDQEIERIRTIITVRIPGVSPESVVISRGGRPLERSGGTGEVRFADPLQGRLGPEDGQGDSYRVGYAIVIAAGTQPAKGEIIAEATSDGNRLGGDSEGIEIRVGRGGRTQPAPTTPPNTDPGIVPTFGNSAAPEAFQPLDPTSRDVDTGMPVFVYIAGVVLLGLGGALLWLLFRQRGPGGATVVATGPDGGARSGTTARFNPVPGGPLPTRPTGPSRHAVHQPTAVLPPVRAPHPRLDPPSDPWAGQADDHSYRRREPRTRDFDPFEDR
jgi:hypothetical protein